MQSDSPSNVACKSDSKVYSSASRSKYCNMYAFTVLFNGSFGGKSIFDGELGCSHVCDATVTRFIRCRGSSTV